MRDLNVCEIEEVNGGIVFAMAAIVLGLGYAGYMFAQ
jgi:lactobin A/cerein 7B family class IIb bacteriocin